MFHAMHFAIKLNDTNTRRRVNAWLRKNLIAESFNIQRRPFGCYANDVEFVSTRENKTIVMAQYPDTIWQDLYDIDETNDCRETAVQAAIRKTEEDYETMLENASDASEVLAIAAEREEELEWINKHLV